MLAATVAWDQPLFWAVFIGWVMSVVVHEFAHGIVAYWGGDYTIRERGGLTLNPLQYVDPLFSLVLPMIFLLMGGVPLPGGATYVNRDLIRNRAWETAMSLAGPASNLLLCLLCVLPMHPAVGWVDTTAPMEQWSAGARFLGAMALLQFVTVIFNLIPVPPLDGFQAAAPWLLTREQWYRLATPPTSTMFFIGLFVLLNATGGRFFQLIYQWFDRMLLALGFDYYGMEFIRRSFNSALFGSTN
jgi:Zn-dependent protease